MSHCVNATTIPKNVGKDDQRDRDLQCRQQEQQPLPLQATGDIDSDIDHDEPEHDDERNRPPGEQTHFDQRRPSAATCSTTAAITTTVIARAANCTLMCQAAMAAWRNALHGWQSCFNHAAPLPGQDRERPGSPRNR